MGWCEADHSTISLTSIADDTEVGGVLTEYNDVTITPKPITITGVEVDDKIYDGGTSANIFFGNVDWDAIGRVSDDSLFLTTKLMRMQIYLPEPLKIKMLLPSSTVLDKTVNLTNRFKGTDEELRDNCPGNSSG